MAVTAISYTGQGAFNMNSPMAVKTYSCTPLFDTNLHNNLRNAGGYKVQFDSNGYPIPDGENLTFTEGESYFFGLIKRNAEYTYKANGRESIKDIRSKFHLKDGALKKCNSYIVDADLVPDKGCKIYFLKDDIKVQR